MQNLIIMNLFDLPKVELHLHLEGAAQPEFIKMFSKGKGLKSSHLFNSQGNYKFNSFSEFLSIYESVTSLFKTPEDFKVLTESVLEECVANNIIYVESFISPEWCGGNDVSAWKEYVQAMEEASDAAKKKNGIIFKAIVTCIRHLGPEKASRAALCAAETVGNWVVGFGMAGDEKIGRQKDYLYSFHLAREAKLHLTTHAGEWCGAESVRDAIEHLEVERIGHGVQAVGDDDLLSLIKEKQVVLEVCPGSNIALGIYKNLENHPIKTLRDAAVKVTISTDDPPFFNTSLSKEYTELESTFGWDLHDFKDLNITAASAAFCDEVTKKKLINTLNNSYTL